MRNISCFTIHVRLRRIADWRKWGIEPMYDIVKVAGNGEPVWLEALSPLDAALARVTALQESFPGEYLLVSQGTGKRIQVTASGAIHRN